jgi:hypothetical protein
LETDTPGENLVFPCAVGTLFEGLCLAHFTLDFRFKANFIAKESVNAAGNTLYVHTNEENQP